MNAVRHKPTASGTAPAGQPDQAGPSTAGMRLFLASVLVVLFLLHLGLLTNFYSFLVDLF